MWSVADGKRVSGRGGEGGAAVDRGRTLREESVPTMRFGVVS